MWERCGVSWHSTQYFKVGAASLISEQKMGRRTESEEENKVLAAAMT